MKYKDNSKEVLARFEQCTERALDAIGTIWEGNAKRYAPVDTGRLEGGITYEKDVPGRAVKVGDTVDYGPYQELGTVFQPGTPHIRPGALNHTAELKAGVEAAYRPMDGD